jgi:kynurenine formamidase
MENGSNYRTLAMAIVAQALEDAEGSAQQSHQARQWLAMQQVISIAGVGLFGNEEYCQMCYSSGAPPQHRGHDATPFRAKLLH